MKVKPFIANKPDGTIQRGEMLSFGLRGKLGPTNSYGRARFGVSKFGDNKALAGIYQGRISGYNNVTGRPGGQLKRYFVAMKSYTPTNPQTPAQQAWRGTFADGVGEWHNLTPIEKGVYNASANRLGLSGFCLFMREYLTSQS